MTVLLARVVLAGVFAVAALAKWHDRVGARQSMVAFGVPESVSAPLTWSLIAFELVASAALLVAQSATVGAMVSLVMLAGFAAAIIVNLARGRRSECHCFGRLSNAPVGWTTVARDATLATVAGYIIADGHSPLLFAGIIVITAGSWVLLGPVRSRGQRQGDLAPAFSVTGAVGSWTLDKLLAPRHPVVLVFSHSACGACSSLMHDVVGWQSTLNDKVTIAVLSGGSRLDGEHEAAALGLDNYLFDEGSAVGRTYGVTATPSAVLVGRDGRIAASMAQGAGEIADLVASSIETSNVPRIERRVALGLAAAATLPLLGSACSTTGAKTQSTTRPKTLHIDGAYICDQQYALCTDAPCIPSKSDPSIVICTCVTKMGYSVGFKSCSERERKGDTLHSNFSTQLVTSSTRVMTCPADIPWGNCLDVVCNVDPHDASKVQCQCVLVDTGPSLTFGGECQTKTCSSTIWSAATSNLPGSTQLKKGMQQIGLPLTLPKSCPTS
jgi:hypothetical protein